MAGKFQPIDETDPERIRARMHKLERGGAAAEQLGLTDEADECAIEYMRLEQILQTLEEASNGLSNES